MKLVDSDVLKTILIDNSYQYEAFALAIKALESESPIKNWIDYRCSNESNSAYSTQQLKSYTCSHCGGNIDVSTLTCKYCGARYFFN